MPVASDSTLERVIAALKFDDPNPRPSGRPLGNYDHIDGSTTHDADAHRQAKSDGHSAVFLLATQASNMTPSPAIRVRAP
jgi:hypothetical protein